MQCEATSGHESSDNRLAQAEPNHSRSSQSQSASCSAQQGFEVCVSQKPAAVVHISPLP